MPLREKPRVARVVRWTGGLALLLLPGTLPVGAVSLPAPRGGPDPGAILSEIRPDYRDYILALRPLPSGAAAGAVRRVYMVLVRPGAVDPSSRESAPLAGHGARNDVLYDRSSLNGPRSEAWALLLLDHEYFHARHLAGATSLPLPEGVGPEAARHFFEAAAWGFNVAEARAGRYPGLRPDEFSEALDRYGEHYRALRALTREPAPQAWALFSHLLLDPVRLLRTNGSPR
jgi:hypothetical protein